MKAYKLKEGQEFKKQQTEKDKIQAKRGVDEPMPQRRGSKAEVNRSFEGIKQAGIERALSKKGSLLDLRSPHILRRQNEEGQKWAPF